MIRKTLFLPLLLAAGAALLPPAGANQPAAAPGARAAQPAPQPAAAPDYFPLGAGNHWTYVESANGAPTGASFDVKVVPPTVVPGGLDNYWGNGKFSVVHETAVGTVVYDLDMPVVGPGGSRMPIEYQIEAILWDEHAANGVEGRMARTIYSVLDLP